MKDFIRSNALKSLFFNLIANIVIPFFIFLNDKFVYLKEGAPVLLPSIIAAVLFSTIVTFLITFGTLTAKRKKGEVDLPIQANANWFASALITGIITGIVLALIAVAVFLLIQNFMDNIAIPKIWVLIISGVVGAAAGFFASLIAARYAAKIK